MASLKEVSVEIKGYPYRFFRRVEKSDIPLRHKDYLPFVITFTPEDNPEVLFNHSDETLNKLKNEYPQEIFATGVAYLHHPDKKIDEINLRTKSESAPAKRKVWAEAVVGRINPMVMHGRVWIAIDEKEFYIYNPPLGLGQYQKSEPKISQIFPSV